MRDKYIHECTIIQENSTWNAETHHFIALSAKRTRFWLQVIPASISAILLTLIVSNIIPAGWIFISTVAAVAAAVNSVIDPHKEYFDHLFAAKKFTSMKHRARALHETFSTDMSDDEFKLAVRQLHQDYSCLVEIVPPTNGKAFKKTKKRIESGVHKQDDK